MELSSKMNLDCFSQLKNNKATSKKKKELEEANMSPLVDYAVSDEEEEIDEVKESAAPPPLSSPAPTRPPPSIPPPNSQNR